MPFVSLNPYPHLLNSFHPTHQKKENAILVGVVTPGQSRWEVEDALDELELLADTAGARVTDRVVQVLPQINAATFVGKGKVEHLKQLVAQHNTDLVVFDDDLAPIQIRNLEKALGCKLLDRSGLILDIFASRAQSATAKTQVELAQLEYLLTRLTRQWTHLSRQKGGIGTKGPGETQIETDRRLIGRRIATLKDRLAQIDRQRQTQRKRRGQEVRVSLVGYTNAGKSTLMNTLAGAGVLAENRLFATLDATTRQVFLKSNRSVLLSDTVGFIRKLPHRLIESFKSTLDEVRESDLLLHIVDVTHPNFEEHIRVVNQTLKELGAEDKPTMMVFNKVDALTDKSALSALQAHYERAAFISAQRGIGIEELKTELLALVEEDFVVREALLPVAQSKAVAYLHEVAEVEEEIYVLAHDIETDESEPAVHLRFRISKKQVDEIERMLLPYRGLEVERKLTCAQGKGDSAPLFHKGGHLN